MKIGEILVKEKLAACVNYFPIESVYFWKGKLQNDKETVLLIKTVEKNFNKIEKRIKQLHSYEAPCIVAIPTIKSSKDYFKWVKKQTR